MAKLGKLAAIVGAAGLVRGYARKNPDKFNKITDRVGSALNARTNGKYSSQIDRVMRGVRNVGGDRPSGSAG